MNPFASSISAPDFPPGLQWLNTSQPLSLGMLRGKIVLLDFWTYCCINCMRIIPDLKKLEKKYGAELVVIGVHSAKFTSERETENIRQAILRYEIEHPVVNDRDFEIWRAYDVNAWPTVILIDPTGKIVAHHAGEGIYQPLDELISDLITKFASRGLLKRESLRLDIESTSAPERFLSFPGKVLADETSGRLFISDSNHNRIVIATLSGDRVLDVIGSGLSGLADGSFEESSFNHPQGLALGGDILYIADTENHSLRRADLKARKVVRIAGNGQQADFASWGGIGVEAELSSPWDLVLLDDSLYIAMAGTHQLWVMNLASGQIQPYAGSGREGRLDGRLLQAALAQPSGLTTDGRRLYFADSEVSSVRWAELPPGNQVGTVVGLDLFEFGDRDGEGDQVRLQHPLGIVFYQGLLYVADTYNNKVKVVNPQEKSARTLLGSGKSGLDDGASAQFYEPGGISAAGGKLYIADTNNHRIRVANPNSRQVTTLPLRGMEKLAVKKRMADHLDPQIIVLDSQKIKSGPAILSLDLQLPDGHKLNDQAPTKVVMAATNGHIAFQDGAARLMFDQPSFPLQVPFTGQEGVGEISLDLFLYYCRSDEEPLCFFREAHLLAPFEVGSAAEESTLKILFRLE